MKQRKIQEIEAGCWLRLLLLPSGCCSKQRFRESPPTAACRRGCLVQRWLSISKLADPAPSFGTLAHQQRFFLLQSSCGRYSDVVVVRKADDGKIDSFSGCCCWLVVISCDDDRAISLPGDQQATRTKRTSIRTGFTLLL